MIVSGDKLAYLEPQEKTWRGESGRSYPIQETHRQNKLDSLAPFEGVAGFSSQEGIYPGTLFRFPLRNTASGLSENLYTIQKLRDVLVAIREEAKFLLLFLRSVQEINVYEISQHGQCTLSFQVELREKEVIGRKQKSFLGEVRLASAPYLIFRGRLTPR